MLKGFSLIHQAEAYFRDKYIFKYGLGKYIAVLDKPTEGRVASFMSNRKLYNWLDGLDPKWRTNVKE